MTDEQTVQLRAGGWFACYDGDEGNWSGPWNTKEAAQAAYALDYDSAHLLHTSAGKVIRDDD